MSLRDLLTWLNSHSWQLMLLLVWPPTLSFLLSFKSGRKKESHLKLKYLYSVIVYSTTIPGILATVLTGYALFFTKENLLDVNLITYLAPIVAMLATLFLVAKNIDFNDIPGFDRISGLMLMIGLTFLIVLGVAKTRIWLIFGSSIFMLFGLCVGVFVALRWGASLLIHGKQSRD